MNANFDRAPAAKVLTSRGAKAISEMARLSSDRFRRLTTVHKAAVICAGTAGAALCIGDQIYGTDILRNIDPSIAVPLSPKTNQAALAIHKYCDPRPQTCIDNVNEANAIAGMYVDEKGKSRGWFHRYIWNDDAHQKRELTSYVIGLWGIEGALSKTPAHTGSHYQGPLQFSLDHSTSYIWDANILVKLLPLLNAMKSTNFIKMKYPALANRDVITRYSHIWCIGGSSAWLDQAANF
jgi:hypothetical protein